MFDKYKREKISQPVPTDISNPLLRDLKPSVLEAPTANRVSSLSSTSFLATWDVTDESLVSKYYLDVSTDGFMTYLNGYQNRVVNGKIELVSGLIPYTSYSYRVRVVGFKEVSDYSNTINVYTKMLPPVTIPATDISNTNFIANWLKEPNATHYYLDVSPQLDFSTFVLGFENVLVGNLSFFVKGLQFDTTYYYRVRAYNLNTDTLSKNSNITSVVTRISAPQLNVSTNILSTSFTVNWSLINNAIDYTLDLSTSSTFSTYVGSYHDFSTGNVTSVTVSGLTEDVTYYARLRASTLGGATSNYSNIVITITNLDPPIATSPTSKTNTAFVANWNSILIASSYRFDLSTDNFTTFVSGYNNRSVASNFLNITGLTSDTEYKYRVRAVGSSTSPSVSSNTITTTTLLNAPVTITETDLLSNSFTANWNSVSNATLYYIDVSTDSLFSSIVVNNQSTSNNYYSVTGLSQLTNYYYRVRAFNLNGTSANSNITNTFTTIAPPVAQAPSGVNSSEFTAEWGSVSSTDGYYLDVSSDNFVTFLSGYNDKLVISTSDLVSGLNFDTEYKYRVRSRYNLGQLVSINSNTITVSTLLNAPNATPSTSVTSNSFVANWDTVVGAVSYRLDVSDDDFVTNISGYDNLSTLLASQSVTGLSGYTTYKYRVRAISSSSIASLNSNEISVNTLSDSPTILNSSNVVENSFDITWSSVVGALSYRLDVSDDEFFGTFISGYNNRSVVGLTDSVTGLNSNVIYYCRVRAVFSLSTSLSSLVFPVLTQSRIIQYLFSEGSGTTLQDDSPNNNDGFVLATTPDPSTTIVSFSFSEGSGTVLTDLSENLNDATIETIPSVPDLPVFNYTFTEGVGYQLNDVSGNLNNAEVLLTDIIVYTKLVAGKQAIVSRDMLGNETVLLGDNTYDYVDPSFSDDFSMITFVKLDGSNSQLGILSSNLSTILYVGADNNLLKSKPKLSPNHMDILYVKYNALQTFSSIYTIGVDGTGEVNVTNGTYQDNSPNWVSNTEILYETVASLGGQYFIKKKNLVSSVVTTIYTNPQNQFMFPDLSKDKTLIVFHKWDSASKQNICIVNLDGTGFVQLEDLSFSSINPQLSQDKTKIAYLSDRYNSQYYLWIINVDGTSPVNFTRDDLDVVTSTVYPNYGSFVDNNILFQYKFFEGTGLLLNDYGSLNVDSQIVTIPVFSNSYAWDLLYDNSYSMVGEGLTLYDFVNNVPAVFYKDVAYNVASQYPTWVVDTVFGNGIHFDSLASALRILDSSGTIDLNTEGTWLFLIKLDTLSQDHSFLSKTSVSLAVDKAYSFKYDNTSNALVNGFENGTPLTDVTVTTNTGIFTGGDVGNVVGLAFSFDVSISSVSWVKNQSSYTESGSNFLGLTSFNDSSLDLFIGSSVFDNTTYDDNTRLKGSIFGIAMIKTRLTDAQIKAEFLQMGLI